MLKKLWQSAGITGVPHYTCLGKQFRILMHAGQAFYQLGYLPSSLKTFYKVIGVVLHTFQQFSSVLSAN